MANSYLPRTDAGKMQWLNNFVAKLPNYKERLGLTEETLKEFSQDAENFEYMIGGMRKVPQVYSTGYGAKKPAQQWQQKPQCNWVHATCTARARTATSNGGQYFRACWQVGTIH